MCLLAGCASASKPEAMVPAEIKVQNRHARTVSVQVSGGQQTDPMWASQIADADLRRALEMSITKFGVFTGVLNTGQGDYHLVVKLAELDQPGMGFNMTVRVSANWSLTKAGASEPVFSRRIQGGHTATVGDAFAGVKRLRLANEGAARDMISKGLARIAALDL
jgi:hypothetical protein